MICVKCAGEADGSAGEVGSLEEQMTTLKKIVDEAMVLQEYEVCTGGKIIKVHTVEIEQDPNKVEGGKGDILIRADFTTAEQKSVASDQRFPARPWRGQYLT